MRVAIAGASAGGLAAAVALARKGHRVQLFERDAAPADAAAGDSGASPPRRGTPQARHSHAFLGRLRVLLREREPGLLDALKRAGASELGFDRIAAEMIETPLLEPEDEAVTLLACRRTTFESTLRQYAAAQPNIELRSRGQVIGFVREGDDGASPRIAGLRVRDRSGSQERIAADLVIDATGRRGGSDAWLAAAGIAPMRAEREECGIFYASRFYRMRDCVDAPSFPGGVMAADLGYLKAGLFPGDAGTFSLTLAASTEDAPLRSLMTERGFDIAARVLPAVAPHVHPDAAEPISRVYGMGGLESVRRFALREDGEPVAVGLALVGDALVHTNPLYGRGCTLAFVHAYALADALACEPEAGREFALELDERVAREIVPWYESGRMQDRDARAVAAMLASGEDPYADKRADGSVDPRAYMRALMRDGLGPALREDVTLLRAFLRVFNLLDPPQDLMRDPSILQRVLASYARRETREPVPLGPDRSGMLERLAA